MKAATRENVEKYFDWIDKMKPDFKFFYQKVVAQQITRSSLPVITLGEFDTMHRKYPNAFIKNHKGEIEVKELNQLPSSVYELNQK